MKDNLPVHAIEDATPLPPLDFTSFMRNYQNMVYSTALRLVGDESHAEDIAQEVFLKAYERYGALQTSSSVGGWLKTVATNLSLNHLQRYRKRWKFFSEFKSDSDGDDEAEVEFASPENFLTGVNESERKAWVEACLAKLPDHQRIPLVLYHFEELSYEEISAQLGVSLAKVKTDILRAREALAKVLVKSGASHEKFNTENR